MKTASDLSSLLEEITNRIEKSKLIVGEAGLDGDWDRAQAVGAAAKSLERIMPKAKELERELRKGIAEFDKATQKNTKSPQTHLAITICWSRAGRSIPGETIAAKKAADTLVGFIESMVRQFGPMALPIIAKIGNGGSGLISQNSGDFRNPQSGELYGHSPIGKTGWFVKTHSSTETKAEQIRQITKALDLNPSAVEIKIVEK